MRIPNGDIHVNTDGATPSRKHARTIRAHTSATSAPYRKSTTPPAPPKPAPPRISASSRTSTRRKALYFASALPPTLTPKRSHSPMNAAYSPRNARRRSASSRSRLVIPATTNPHNTRKITKQHANIPSRQRTHKKWGAPRHQHGSRTRPTKHPHTLYDQSVCGALCHSFTNTTLTPAARPSSITRLSSLAFVTTITMRVNCRHFAAAANVSPQYT